MFSKLNGVSNSFVFFKRTADLFSKVNKCLSALFVFLLLTGFASISYAMAPPPGGDGGPQGIGAMVQSFLPLILIFVIFYFLLIRPQSKKAKEHKALLENLKKGDKIMTSGGIHGVIDDIDGDSLTLKVGIGSDVKIKVSRGYVAGLRT
jgi:preprotein translocase subunit YajC